MIKLMKASRKIVYYYSANKLLGKNCIMQASDSDDKTEIYLLDAILLVSRPFSLHAYITG